jgi:hypothetical protein
MTRAGLPPARAVRSSGCSRATARSSGQIHMQFEVGIYDQIEVDIYDHHEVGIVGRF